MSHAANATSYNPCTLLSPSIPAPRPVRHPLRLVDRVVEGGRSGGPTLPTPLVFPSTSDAERSHPASATAAGGKCQRIVQRHSTGREPPGFWGQRALTGRHRHFHPPLIQLGAGLAPRNELLRAHFLLVPAARRVPCTVGVHPTRTPPHVVGLRVAQPQLEPAALEG